MPPKNQKKSNGFTLIELIITVAIIAILAGIAYPQYTKMIQKSKRKDAVFALTDIASRQERYFAEYNVYTATVTNLGLSNNLSPDGLYTISLTVGTPTVTFSATATPVSTGSQASDASCATLVLSSTGAKTSTGTASSSVCWK